VSLAVSGNGASSVLRSTGRRVIRSLRATVLPTLEAWHLASSSSICEHGIFLASDRSLLQLVTPMKLSSVFTSLICAVSFLAAKTSQAASHGKAEHIVVVVWDGMRPDFIRPQYTPRLYQLARGGVFFKNHHALYISSTEVNGTGLATGVYPDRSGIMSNSDYRPEIGWLGPQGTESLEAVRRGDWLTEGNYLQVPTIAEILQRHGQPTIIAGTKPVALLFDRALKRTSPAASNSVMLYRGRTIPSAVLPR